MSVLGQNPNLEQMGRIRLGGIRLTVANPGARAHTLSITGTNYRAVSHAVLVFERAFKQIGDDLHVAMRMRGKTMSGLHPIFVDDSKGAESHVAGIVILIEGEAVASVSHPWSPPPRSSLRRIVIIEVLVITTNSLELDVGRMTNDSPGLSRYRNQALLPISQSWVSREQHLGGCPWFWPVSGCLVAVEAFAAGFRLAL